MCKYLLTALIMLMTSCQEQSSVPLIVAHRGASYDAPENTIPAFLLAWEQGADAIEGDFFLTRDGEIVCIHDANTKRVSGKDMLVRDSDLADLRLLDVGVWKDEQWKGTGIPTLGEVFELVPEGKKILVEVKSGTEILPRLLEEIDRSGLNSNQVLVISFNSDVIKEFKSARPGHKAFWLSGFRKDEKGNSVPGIETVIETLASTGADGFSSHFEIPSRDYIDRVREAGYEYHVWTVNEPSIALDLWKDGVLSITTDKPGVMIKYFNTQESFPGR
jgi:glycerophosphoryl diester phosphodiesterase